METPTKTLDCVTWNVHRGQGRDGRIDPDRIMDVIATDISDQRPHLLALQEADTDCPPHSGVLDIARIEADTGLHHLHREDRLKWGPDSHGFLGTILFLHPTSQVLATDVIDLPGHCHRGAIVATIMHNNVALRVISTHLSLSQPLRMAQMRTIGQFLRRHDRVQTILLGDLNEWRPWGGLAFSKGIVGRQLKGPALATFPAVRPFLPLDRILSDAPNAVDNLRTLDSPAIRMASDHRPLAGTVRLDPTL